MPDPYMPDVKVEIAFNAGYTTPAASRVWTDVSQYVELDEGIDMEIGRQDERATADANTLTLTLDNSDGRFTAGRSGSPYFPNVKVGRPIRVTSTPVGGTASTRFVGFVDEWPVEWEGSDAYAKAKVRATSRLSRLGLTASLRSMPEASIMAPKPAFYWTLGDQAGSTMALESSGNGGPQLVPARLEAAPALYPVVFGSATGSPVDGLTAAQFTGDNGAAIVGDYLFATGLQLPAATARSVRALVRITNLYFGGTIAGGPGYGLSVNSSGQVRGIDTTSPTSIADGKFHDVMVTRNGTSERLYVDGIQVATSASAPTTTAADTCTVGYGFEGVIAHVAIYRGSPSPAEVANQASSVLTGGSGERSDQRVTRLLEWVGVTSSEITVQTGAETMTYQKTDGQSVVDALGECESTEGGVLFDGRDGNVTFHNRSNRYLKTAAATLNMAAQHVERDYSPNLDRSTLTNDVTVSNPTTEQTARSTDTASQAEYGIATLSATSVASTYDAMQQKAAWTVAAYAEPRSRVPSLTVDVLAHQGLTPSTQTLLGVNVGDLLAVTNAPTQAATTSPSYFVEGYSERIGPQSYEITYNLSPTYPALSTFVLDDTTRGVLDSSYVLAL